MSLYRPSLNWVGYLGVDSSSGVGIEVLGGLATGSGDGFAGGFEESYFSGDSFLRKSRRAGSRSRRGSLPFSSVFQSQPMMRGSGECGVVLLEAPK